MSDGGAAVGKLQLMDKLEQANGVDVSSLSHEETIDVIKKAGVLHLVISRGAVIAEDTPTGTATASAVSTPRVLHRKDSVGKRVVVPAGVPEAVHVTLERPNMAASFGFGIGSTAAGEQMVTKVSPGGPAVGHLYVGDRLTHVNGTAIDVLDHDAVIQCIVAGLAVDLDLERNVAPPSVTDTRASISRAYPSKKIYNRKDSIGRKTADAPPSTTFELNVTLTRQDYDTSFGFGIGTAFNGAKVVTSVNPGGIAESKIAVFDGIQSINGHAVGDKSHEETVQLVTSALELALVIERPTSPPPSALNAKKSISVRDPAAARTLVARGDSLGSSHRADSGAMTVNVRLTRNNLHESFGFGLGTSTAGEKLVTKVAEHSPAWNKLYAGDAVMQVNGEHTSHLMHDAVVDMITEALDLDLEISRVSSTAKSSLGRKASISQVAPNTQLLERRDELGRQLVNIPAGVPTQLTMTLNRPSLTTSFGFGLGTTPGGEKVVTSVSAGGLAVGKLEVADRVFSVNGKPITSMDHGNAIQLVAGAVQVTLVVQRNVTPQGLQRHATISKHDGVRVLGRHDSIGKAALPTELETLDVVIERTSVQQGFGMGVGPTHQGEHLVTMVTPGGCSDGKLATGDKVVSINGTALQGVSHADFVKMVTPQTRLALVVQRRAARVHVAHPATIAEEEPVAVAAPKKMRLNIRLERPDMQTSFGFGMGTTTTGDQIVSKVTPGGLSEDKLVVGDVIRSINGISTYHANHDDSVANICSGLACDLSVDRRPGKTGIDRRGSISTAHPEQASKILLRRDSIGRPTILMPTGTPDQHTVVLERATMDSSFGFGLGTTTDGEKVVTKVSEGGIAVGQLEVSDVVKQVNGQDAKGMVHADVVALVCSSTVVNLVIHRVAGHSALAAAAADGTTDAEFNKRESITTAAPAVGDRIMQRRDSIGRRVMQIPTGPTQALKVVLERPTLESSFGFGIGTTTEGEKIVTKISDGGLAVGQLIVSDMVMAVNGIPIQELDHNGVIALICEGTTLALDIHRVAHDDSGGDAPRKGSITEMAPQRHITKRRDSIGKAILHVPAGEPRVLSVRLVRAQLGDSFGFGVGTAESGETLVTNVHEGTDASSLLQVADIIVAVNGTPVASRSHAVKYAMLV